MPLIQTHQVEKRFHIPIKSPGLKGALRHLIRPRYRETIAVHPLDLVINAGESVGYAGPNGAGKSTTLKMLSGVLIPTSGEVRVNGLVPHRSRQRHAKNIGVVFGQRTQLWWDLPVRESFRLLGDIYEVPRRVFAKNLDECVEAFDIERLLAKPARQLSLGERMRCDLTASLLHSPPILFLDEPTVGLDVAVKARMRKLLNRKHDEGVTILLTSHDLGDIRDLCSRIILIDNGKIVYDGDLARFVKRFAKERKIVFHLDVVPEGIVERIRTAFAPGMDSVRVDLHDVGQVSVTFEAERLTTGAVLGILMPMLAVRDVTIEEPSLESIILRMYEGELVVCGA